MLSVEQARQRILEHLQPLGGETVSLAQGLGRVLAEDVIARLTQPPVAVSAMDGYAVRTSDAAAVPVTLTVIGEAPAGGAFAGQVGRGQAVQMFTGGPLPQGADAVVIQEDTDRQGDAVTINFEGRIDGEAFEGGKAEGFDLTLGSGAFIPGFEDQLLGAKAGDEKTVAVKFPENYGAANLAGKDAEFAVKVTAVKGADDRLKEKIFGCMSSRAAAQIADELEAKGPMRVTDVQEAQKAVIAIARRLSDAGSMMLAGRGDDFV